MAIRRALLFLKPLEAEPSCLTARLHNSGVKIHLESRSKNHKDAVTFCQNVLQKKSIPWDLVFRNNLVQPIEGIDIVVTIGGDGTLLQASHYMDDSVPILGVNSDPTNLEEVKKLSKEFDATRSTGYLCAATMKNFEMILDEIYGSQRTSSNLSRLSICLNGRLLQTHALNDVLIAHPCPAALSRFSFRVERQGHISPLQHCRSSGIRIATAAGSTAAIHSAGGFPMDILCKDIQYMVREPIQLETAKTCLMHGIVKTGEILHIKWCTAQGVIYIDGSHVSHPIEYGDTIELSCKAPILKVFLPAHLLQEQK